VSTDIWRFFKRLTALQTDTCMRRSRKGVKVCVQMVPNRRRTKSSYQALDDRIEEFGEHVKEHYGIAELGDPSSSTDACCFVTFSFNCF
jgi:hypothetical protein